MSTNPPMRPLRIVAHMETGIAHASPWGISLDGILASQLLHTTRPHQSHLLDQPNPADLDLPLGRCTANPTWWHWAATCAWPDPVPNAPEIHTWTKQFDHTAAEQVVAKLPKTITTKEGRYKTAYMPLHVTSAATLTWHALGDPEALHRLLCDVTAIGKKRSQGEGRVLRWHITDAAIDAFTAAHLSPTGVLARPCPAECVAGRGIADGGSGWAAIRPPHMHPSRMTAVRLPAQPRP